MNRNTKSKIMEKHWLEYLQWLKNKLYNESSRYKPRPTEKGFWQWYVEHKMEVTI